jgi:hypothetical protein
LAEEEQFDLRLPPGIPNMEDLLSEVLEKFDLKLVTPKHLDQMYYMALRGRLEEVKAAKEYIRTRLEAFVAKLEKK